MWHSSCKYGCKESRDAGGYSKKEIGIILEQATCGLKEEIDSLAIPEMFRRAEKTTGGCNMKNKPKKKSEETLDKSEEVPLEKRILLNYLKMLKERNKNE